jgi:L-asparaginase
MTLLLRPGPPNKNVCILYTGGTIGMQLTAGGFAPASGYFEEQMTSLIRQAGRSLPACEVHSMQPLLDSVNIVPADWLRMAAWIAGHHLRYGGFVIVHGTDTMAYTASALAFLLRGLGKPVILTGSMLPLGQPESDALPNLVGALNSAADSRIGEVCIYFGGKLLRGCRSTKVSAWRKDAFASPNCPTLGDGFPRPRLHRAQLLPRCTPPSEILVPSTPVPIGLVKIYPGMNLAVLESALQAGLKGVVLETYGMGSIPENIPGFIALLHRMVERGSVLVSVSQCTEKSPEPGQYQSGAALSETGVIAGGDMTHEAAFAKLFTLLSLSLPFETICQQIPQNLCGELTVRERVTP